MRYIEADLHNKSITFCVVETDGRGIRVVKRQRNMCCEVKRIKKFVDSHTPCELTVEATIGYEWFAALAEKFAKRVVVAHAGKLRIIAESTRKTDKIDAYVLAEFLAREVLASMPGVGVVTVDTILAELGDWTRFSNADTVVSYAGLDPVFVRVTDTAKI